MAEVVGRYAPSPTGDLHFGSLVAAVASFCHARARGGLWRLRIDDLDSPRVVAGAAERIRATLTAFGLIHDGPVMVQSARGAAYDQAITQLKAAGLAFDCGCTRREARAGPQGLEGPIYPGTCRGGLPRGRAPRSVRLVTRNQVTPVVDPVQGRLSQNLARDIGDFVIRRADGITAYQLATVIDDAAQGVTEVVRGADLASSSPRQRWLQQCLWLPTTHYLHVPIVVDEHGEKLGKSTGALPLDPSCNIALLREVLALLGQPVAAERPGRDTVNHVLASAIRDWNPERIPRVARIRRTARPVYQRS